MFAKFARAMHWSSDTIFMAHIVFSEVIRNIFRLSELKILKG